MESQDTLVVQGKIAGGRGRRSDFGGRGRGRGRDGDRSGGREKVIYCYYCNDTDHTKYNCPLLQKKQQQQSFRSAHVATTHEEQSDSTNFVSEEKMKK